MLGEPHTPAFYDVLVTANGLPETTASLEAFATALLDVVQTQLRAIDGPVHCLLSGGYDSRLLASMLEHLGKQPLYITDGMEEPACTKTLDHLKVPTQRRYLHDMTRPDPYSLARATCGGFAPLYTQLRFTPSDSMCKGATLVTGLGGGEWFSYPAAGWHDGKQHRIPHDSVLSMWMDCWPQYTLIPEAWGRPYKAALHPYCTPAYGVVAATARSEWLVEEDPDRELDVVRAAMLRLLDDDLEWLGYAPHRYEWNLSDAHCSYIDQRYLSSYVGSTFHRDEWGLPHLMDKANHACTVAGLATWVETLRTKGHQVV